MQESSNKAFHISIVLHVTFFTCLGLAALFQSCKKKPDPHVFTLMPPPSSPLQEVQASAQEPLDLEAPTLPEPLDRKPLPELPSKPPAPKPKVSKPEPTPKKMSYEEFVKQQGKPNPPKKKANKPQKIDTRAITHELKVVLSSSSSASAPPLSSNDLAAIQAYNRRLRTKIDAVWKKPTAAGDLGATVQFSLNSQGNIYEVKIVKSSGNELFDASILQAFKTVGNAGPPPNQQGGTYQVRFS